MDYSTDGGKTWNPCTKPLDVSGLTGQTIIIRNHGNDDSFPSSGVTVTIPARREAPKVEVDSRAQTVSSDQGVEFSTDNGRTWTALSKPLNTADHLGQTILFRFPSTKEDFASRTVTVVISNHPGAPILVFDPDNETLNTTPDMEYSTDGGKTWKPCTSPMDVSDLAGKEILIRYPGKGDGLPSEAITVKIPARRKAPEVGHTDETRQGRNDGTLTKTVTTEPSSFQQEMVAELGERAEAVRNREVEPDEDNMLKITSDGRKLGLDQRIINPMLPDEPGTKVNQCVDNILQIWRDGQPEKLTQLVFCDISTPQAAGSKKVAKTLDNPMLHALEQAAPEPEKPLAFTVYEDIRQKLIAQGMPASQIAFIHEANTEVRKKELFSKVRSGQVRVLLGSTQKMGAGTNVQDLLVALHDLDCPWRPGDLAQRKGRIERQGNQNPLVHVYRYVTEGTFDAYLWQTVENKQKFISQIMTSKSPVRSCDDVDETALSFAEIKALCAGDPRIKERMDLDVEVSRLKLMKADHQSKQYRLEDQLLKHFPEEIEKHKGFIQGLETDMETLAAHPHPTDGFTGMEVRGDTLTDKENAGAALLDACKEVKGSEPVQVGSYRGFAMFVTFDAFQKEYMLQLKGRMTHRTALGADPRGNLTRIDNALSQMPQRLESVKVQLDNLYQQQAAAKEEVGKAFPYEEELRVKNARLVELDMELNMDSKGQSRPEAAIAKRERPSVLEGLKRPIPPRSMEKKPRQQEQEAR